jgi:hypothetical protein
MRRLKFRCLHPFRTLFDIFKDFVAAFVTCFCRTHTMVGALMSSDDLSGRGALYWLIGLYSTGHGFVSTTCGAFVPFIL